MVNETEFGRTVTAEEAAFIAYRLRGHAKAQQKRVAIAMRKGLNPQLIKRMDADATECLRLAAALEVQP